MAKLTTAKKNAEPNKEFGLPKERKYPMPDANHAKNAKARASQMEHQGKLSASDKKKINTKADRILISRVTRATVRCGYYDRRGYWHTQW